MVVAHITDPYLLPEKHMDLGVQMVLRRLMDLGVQMVLGTRAVEVAGQQQQKSSGGKANNWVWLQEVENQFYLPEIYHLY